MHHSLRFYSGHREFILKFYMFFARWTKIPLIGRLVRRVANAYGRNMEGGYLPTTKVVYIQFANLYLLALYIIRHPTSPEL